MPIDGWDDRIDTPEEHRIGVRQGTIQIDFSNMAELRLRFIRQMYQIPNRYFTEPTDAPLKVDDEQQRLQQSFNEWGQKPPPVYVLIRICDPIENFPPIYHDGELVEALAYGTCEEMHAHHKKGTFDSSGYVPLSSLESA